MSVISPNKKSENNMKNMFEAYLHSPVVKSFLAGSLSGTCSTIIFQPLDLVKTRIQSSVRTGQSQSGVVSIIINVVRSEKLIGLWKGVTPSLSRTVPGIGVYFSSLHWLRTNCGSNDPSGLESMFMGVFARAISGTAMLPFTVVKTRFESGVFHYKGINEALVSIYRLEGTKGLFGGLTATLLRDAPFSGIYLMFYTRLKNTAKKSEWSNMQSPLLHFSCGIVAGFLASVVTQPADVVKTQIQLYPDKYSKTYPAIKFIYQEGGFRGFFRGIVPRTMRRTLMAALAWTVYEQMMSSVGLK